MSWASFGKSSSVILQLECWPVAATIKLVKGTALSPLAGPKQRHPQPPAKCGTYKPELTHHTFQR